MHMNEMYQLCQASICLYSYEIRCLDEWYISEGEGGGGGKVTIIFIALNFVIGWL